MSYHSHRIQEATFLAAASTLLDGVDAQNADWNAQAAKKAASYLKSLAFPVLD
jgi:hypothetical protein